MAHKYKGKTSVEYRICAGCRERFHATPEGEFFGVEIQKGWQCSGAGGGPVAGFVCFECMETPLRILVADMNDLEWGNE